MPDSEPTPNAPDGSDGREPAPAQRPGTQPSAPSASHYTPELPYAEELQAMLEGRYLVESFLGQGGMRAVYKGLLPSTSYTTGGATTGAPCYVSVFKSRP